MILKLKNLCDQYLLTSNADCLAVGIIDFKSGGFESFELRPRESDAKLYFDLASLTKPLTNSLAYFASPEVVDEKMLLLLNHQAGLPAWGLLPRHGWREQLLTYPIQASETLYSDFSANRFMLEFDKRSGQSLNKTCEEFWDREVCNWLELSALNGSIQFPHCGFINGRPNFGAVHDPNAWNIKEFMSHAGLFATIDGVCKTLLNYEKKLQLLSRMAENLQYNQKHGQNRFVLGWDTPQGDMSLAGTGCSNLTFGHLGFTGTSIWIDCQRKVGQVLLTNAVKLYWFDKKELNPLRRKIGQLVWKSSEFSS